MISIGEAGTESRPRKEGLIALGGGLVPRKGGDGGDEGTGGGFEYD